MQDSKKKQPTHFNAFIIDGVINLDTFQQGWRIVGLFGHEYERRGYRVGPKFPEDQLEACEQLVATLEDKYGLPVLISTIFAHFDEQPLKG
jgi:hypothetical protein